MFHVKFLFFYQNKYILFKNEISKINIKINTNYFNIFENNYIFYVFDKNVYITKINIFIDVFNNRNYDRRFIVIIKIEKIDINEISSLIIFARFIE